MKPSIGRVVIYEPTSEDRGHSTSTEGFPAVITRVFSDTCVNLAVLRDDDLPVAITSVVRSDPLPDGRHFPRTWRWPERVQA